MNRKFSENSNSRPATTSENDLIDYIEVQKISVTVHDHPAGLRDAWLTLERAGCYAFQAHEFVAAWCDVLAPRLRAAPRIVALFLDDEPLMILPLCIMPAGGLRLLEFIDGGVSDYNAPLLAPRLGDAGALDFRALWPRILASLTGIDGVRLRKMPAEVLGRPNPLLQLDCRSSGTAGHYLDLRDGIGRARSLTREAAKKHRRLCRAHDVTIHDGGGSADLLRRLIGFREAKYRWNPPDRAAIEQFYRHLLERTSLARMFWLSVDGDPVAAQFALVAGGVCTGLIIGYSEAWAEYSPGRILLSYIIGRLEAEGWAAFDSGQGSEPYKLEYSSHERALSVLTQARSIRGWLFLRAWWLARQAGRTIRRRWRRTGGARRPAGLSSGRSR